MRRQVLLLRHAKAEPGEVDIERPLSARGRRDASAVGRWLHAEAMRPDLAVVSPAVRAGQTWKLIARELTAEVPTNVDERIYANTVTDLLAVMAALPATVSRVALVGHNPSLELLARRWLGRRSVPFEGLRTASVAVFACDGEWRAVSRLAFEPTAFTTARG